MSLARKFATTLYLPGLANLRSLTLATPSLTLALYLRPATRTVTRPLAAMSTADLTLIFIADLGLLGHDHPGLLREDLVGQRRLGEDDAAGQRGLGVLRDDAQLLASADREDRRAPGRRSPRTVPKTLVEPSLLTLTRSRRVFLSPPDVMSRRSKTIVGLVAGTVGVLEAGDVDLLAGEVGETGCAVA